VRQHKLIAARKDLAPTWAHLSNDEEFGRNRRNLYALSGAFILFVLGGGEIHHADLFSGSVEFRSPQALYLAAFVLLIYCWWRFEMTLPASFAHVWEMEQIAIYRRTDSFAAMLGLAARGRTVNDGTMPTVTGRWPRVLIKAGVNGPDGRSAGAVDFIPSALRYAYTRACSVLLGVRVGRATSDILLPRVLFVVAVALSVARVVWTVYFASYAPVEYS
jgi:hypothetical protein